MQPSPQTFPHGRVGLSTESQFFSFRGLPSGAQGPNYSSTSYAEI